MSTRVRSLMLRSTLPLLCLALAAATAAAEEEPATFSEALSMAAEQERLVVLVLIPEESLVPITEWFSSRSKQTIRSRYVMFQLSASVRDEAMAALLRRYQLPPDGPSVSILAADGTYIEESKDGEAQGLVAQEEQAWAKLNHYKAEQRRLAAMGSNGLPELARLHEAHRRFDLAVPLYERAVEEAPTLDTMLAFADVLELLGRWERYKAVLQSLIETHPTHPDRLAWRIRLASGEHRPGFAPGPQVPPPAELFELATVLEREGRRGDASQVLHFAAMQYEHEDSKKVELLKQAILLDPPGQSAAQARLELIYYYYHAGDVAESLRCATEFVRHHPNHPEAVILRQEVIPLLRRER